jgi:deoxyribonuclease-4
VAEVIQRLDGLVPVAACIDTCHTHVAGYDIVSEKGMAKTLANLDGTIGLYPFRRLLINPRLAHAAFIAETPIDEPGDDRRNIDALKALVDTLSAEASN